MAQPPHGERLRGMAAPAIRRFATNMLRATVFSAVALSGCAVVSTGAAVVSAGASVVSAGVSVIDAGVSVGSAAVSVTASAAKGAVNVGAAIGNAVAN